MVQLYRIGDNMENLKKYKKIIIFGVLILAVLIFAIIFIFNKINNDGMNNKNIYNVKYKVYQNGKWTKYTKNGMTVGDKEHPIQNLEFKYKTEKGYIYYLAYTEDWTEQIYNNINPTPEKIYGFKINSSNILYKKYDICYRTYNKKDKWLNWTCDGEISGNKKEPITAIEVKMIPKKVIKFDYLKDYNNPLESMKGF